MTAGLDASIMLRLLAWQPADPAEWNFLEPPKKMHSSIAVSFLYLKNALCIRDC